jgi:competence protein ComGC
MSGLFKEFWLFLKQEKKWWLVPMLIVMGVIGVFVVVAVLFPGVAPFIYPLI